MSTVLCIGDLHTKAFLLPMLDETIAETKPDRIIIMGDYADDWDMDPAENLSAVRTILAWARGHDNLTMLFGNHDMAYYSRSGRCSGNAISIREELHGLINENLEVMHLAASLGNWLFTHAGLCQGWALDNLEVPIDAHDAAQQINGLIDDGYGKVRDEIEACGRARGGFEKPGPLWADWSELVDDFSPGINQIVGHTPKWTCTQVLADSGEQLWLCDTFSTTPFGYPNGDGSMLLLDTETDQVRVIPQKDSTAFQDLYMNEL